MFPSIPAPESEASLFRASLRERIGDRWGLLWAWTGLNVLGIVAIIMTTASLGSGSMLGATIFLWSGFTCCAVGQAWLLRLRRSGRLIWILSSALIPILVITGIAHPLVAVGFVHFLQTVAIHTSRDGAVEWFFFVPLSFAVSCGGFWLCMEIQNWARLEVSLLPFASKLLPNDATIAIGWTVTFFFLQGMIVAFTMPLWDSAHTRAPLRPYDY